MLIGSDKDHPFLVGQHALHVTLIIKLLTEPGCDMGKNRLLLVLDEGVVVVRGGRGGRHPGPLELLLGLADLELQSLALDGADALELLEFGTQVVDTLGEDQNSLLNLGIDNLVELILALLLLRLLKLLGFLRLLRCLGFLFLDGSVASFLLHLLLYLLLGGSSGASTDLTLLSLGGGALDAVLFLLDVMVDLRRCLLGFPRLAQLANEVDGGDDTAILLEGVQRTSISNVIKIDR